MVYVPYAVNPERLGKYSRSVPPPAAGRGVRRSSRSAPLGLPLLLLLLVPSGEVLAGLGNVSLLTPLGRVVGLVITGEEQGHPVAAEVDEDPQENRPRRADGIGRPVGTVATEHLSDLGGVVADTGLVQSLAERLEPLGTDEFEAAYRQDGAQGSLRIPSLSGQNEIHHTEEFAYFDLCDHLGFYTLTGQIAAHEPRIVWRASLSFQLSGVPIDPVPLQHLAQRLNETSAAYFRPRNADSVSRHHVRRSDGVPLDVVGFIVENDEDEPDPHDREWAVGVIAKNPFPRRAGPGRTTPEWWPNMAADSELVVCSLRSWHTLQNRKKMYRLWSCESAWTSDALVFNPIADWDNDEDNENTLLLTPEPGHDRPPRSRATLVEPPDLAFRT